MPVFAFSNPNITVGANSFTFAGKCDEQKTFVPKSRVITVDKRGDEVLLFLTESTIIQLYELPSSRDTYDLIVGAL